MEEIPISIVFLNYNRLNETRITAEKLLECKKKLDGIEIIAVDNGSTDGTREYLAGLSASMEIKLLDRNYGIEGYNKGFEISQGNIIIVLDDDSHVEVDTIKRVVELFTGDNNIGIVSFKIVDKNGKRFKTWHIPSDDVFQESFAFVGCGFAVRKDVFREIGFYPENFFLYHNEIDVAIKTRLHGYKIVYDPSCIAIHRTTDMARDVDRRIYYTFKNSLLIIWMYYPFFTAGYMILSRIIISYAFALFHLKTGIATKAFIDFMLNRTEKKTLKAESRRLLKPFFYQNSIFHRIIRI